MTSILSWGENKRNHFRLKSRVILEKLVRKFDFEMVSSFVPKKHQKLMAHIRRANEKRKRKKIHLSEERSDEDTNSGDNTRWKNKPRLDVSGIIYCCCLFIYVVYDIIVAMRSCWTLVMMRLRTPVGAEAYNCSRNRRKRKDLLPRHGSKKELKMSP